MTTFSHTPYRLTKRRMAIGAYATRVVRQMDSTCSKIPIRQWITVNWHRMCFVAYSKYDFNAQNDDFCCTGIAHFLWTAICVHVGIAELTSGLTPPHMQNTCWYVEYLIAYFITWSTSALSCRIPCIVPGFRLSRAHLNTLVWTISCVAWVINILVQAHCPIICTNEHPCSVRPAQPIR